MSVGNNNNNYDDGDGMLLNFAVPEPSSVKQIPQRNIKVSGGRWKERRKLQLTLSGKLKEKPKVKGANSVSILERKTEKRKLDKNDSDGLKSSQNTSGVPKRVKVSGGTKTTTTRGSKDELYVSSLFTNNSKSTAQENTDTVTSEKAYSPSNAPMKDATTFTGLGLNDRLSKHLTEHLRYKYPTKIQKLVIPELLITHNDLFAKAQTGSGKTMAFVLPIFHKLMMMGKQNIGRDSGVFAVILTPTRELANQIYAVLENLNRCCSFIVPGIVIGGEKKKSEKARIRKGVNILVATPGRLVDHLENTKSLDIGQVRYLVLDEGDKLVELGFEETISKITTIIDNKSAIHITRDKWPDLPSKRINILCSATLQNNVKKLGSIFLNNPKMISVDREVEGTIQLNNDSDDDDDDDNNNNNIGGSTTATNSHESFAPEQLTQNIIIVPPKLRLVSLNASLVNFASEIEKSSNASRTMVFFSCSDSVNYHFDVFTRNGKVIKKIKDQETGETSTVMTDPEDLVEENNAIGEVTAPMVNENTVIYKLHGSLSQQTRTTILQNFIKEDPRFPHKILFCTDVASRGLDLPNISNVIEYDAPFTIDDHLHRIGRSARVGKQGNATLFLSPGLEEGYIDAKLKVVHPRSDSLRILNYEKSLQQAFAKEDGSTKKNKHNKLGDWDIHATTWHLDIERWLLEDSHALSRAILAFTSHIRAYATHLSSERSIFNVKALHLGHIAKSFGLRETPKSLGRKSAKVNESSNSESTLSKRKKEDPRKKMLRIAKMAVNSSSSEFNY
ncbi:DBP7 [Candida oxycetoniae]|uniref:ATP-dependent RNA helicase n=1 Tax=Candida oxycetoniae TaxID=497107 RepID=A0AAI9SYL2_9ASCO|nr:DBP7 [Candida oxycetoniae]KAI3405161.2 DBP7 [Candida oxycetoniae]